MRISDWSSDVCSSDLTLLPGQDGCRSSHCRTASVHRRIPCRTRRDACRPRPAWRPHPARSRHNPRSACVRPRGSTGHSRSEEHTSELQSLMRISYAVFCLKKTTTKTLDTHIHPHSKSYHTARQKTDQTD